MNLLRGQYLFDRNAYISAKEPTIFHCHHYNCYLQAVLVDTADYLPGVTDILVNSSQELTHQHFSTHFSTQEPTENRKKIVEDYFRFAGFGIIDLSNLQKEGGTVTSSSDHYGTGWLSKFGKSDHHVSFFSLGFLLGASEAIYNLPLGTLDGKQTSCISKGDSSSTFELTSATSQKQLKPSPQEGNFVSYTQSQPNTPVLYTPIKEALTGMPIEGSAETGLIDAFGVLLTRHYANYYCNISYSFMDLFLEKMGEDGKQTAIELLTEAGHVCAFNTFGGIMQSNEWNGMIKPMFATKEDWVHGIVAVVNALGWGAWEIVDLVPGKKLTLKINNGYESNSYVSSRGQSEFPISFLATGGVAGIMNLVYTLDLPNTAPITLDENQYQQIFLNSNNFVSKQTKCRAMGDDYDEFEAFLEND